MRIAVRDAFVLQIAQHVEKSIFRPRIEDWLV